MKLATNIKSACADPSKPEGNYSLNYHIVEISTRGVFAVIRVLNPATLSQNLKPNRLSTTRRNETKRPRAPGRIIKNITNIKVTFAGGLKTEGNYPNYHNVVISTHDGSAVIKSKVDGKFELLSYQLFKFAQSNVALPEVRISKIFETYQNTMQKINRLHRYRESFANYDYPSRQRTTKPFMKIWPLKQLPIVEMTHSNEKNSQIKARCVCLFFMKFYLKQGCNMHNEIKRKNCLSTMITDNHAMTDKLVPVVRTITDSITVDMKCMVHVPDCSFYSRSWESKHCGATTITKTSDKAMSNSDDTMETQLAVDHIPGVRATSREMQALNDLIENQDSVAQPVSTPTVAREKLYKYDPINDCMQVIESNVTQGVGKGKRPNSDCTGKKTKHNFIFCVCYIEPYYFHIGTEPVCDITESAATSSSNISTSTTQPRTYSDETQASTNATVTNPEKEDNTEVITAAMQALDNSDSTSISDVFSDDDMGTQNANPAPNGGQTDRPLHKRIDKRIMEQKDMHWKGKPRGKGKVGRIEDPRLW